MSRAFVKETDEIFDELPDRPVSPHPNFVTPEGLDAIETTLARFQQQHVGARASTRPSLRMTPPANADQQIRGAIYWMKLHRDGRGGKQSSTRPLDIVCN
jgi:hypothetical protein